jgi:hypothetical protein
MTKKVTVIFTYYEILIKQGFVLMAWVIRPKAKKFFSDEGMVTELLHTVPSLPRLGTVHQQMQMSAFTTRYQMHISVHEKISMDTEMFDKIQALSFGFTIWKPGVRYGIEDPVVAVRISFLYHLVERER